jgi:hypothetical protein
MSGTDRAATQFAIDGDVKAVLEFMQDSFAAARLISIAETLPQMARLLWSHYPQEPVIPMTFVTPKECNQSLPPASECAPVLSSVDGDSVEAADAR